MVSGTTRWVVAALLIVAAAAVIGWAQTNEGMIAQSRMLFTLSTCALVAMLLPLWLWLTSSVGPGTKVLGIVAAAAAVGVVMALVRIDSVTGDLRPQLAWRWSSKTDRGLPDLMDVPSGSNEEANVTTTTPYDSPQFLGRNRDGVYGNVRPDRDWQAHPPREVWRQPIGAGFGSYAIVNGFAITQEQRGENELVVCYELPTGKVRWVHSDPGRFEETIGGTGPRATPTVIDGKVYTQGALGVLNCLDGATGKVIWSRNILEDGSAQNMQWGKSNSPLIVDDLVIATPGGTDNWSVAAYRRDTGEVVWHAGTDPASYSSPIVCTLAGKRQIVVVNRESVTGHAVEDGRVLWRIDWPVVQPKCVQPLVVGEDLVFVTSSYGVGSMLLRVAPDSSSVESIWPARNTLKLKSKFSNVILKDGYLYGLDDGQTITCLVAETGQVQWRERAGIGHGELLLAGDLLIVQAESGELLLVEPKPDEYIELGRITPLTNKTWNNPALYGRYLLVRNHEEAVCYELAAELLDGEQPQAAPATARAEGATPSPPDAPEAEKSKADPSAAPG